MSLPILISVSLPILISVRNENHAFGAPVTAAVCAAVVSFCAEALAAVQVRKRRARVAVRIVALFIVIMFLVSIQGKNRV